MENFTIQGLLEYGSPGILLVVLFWLRQLQKSVDNIKEGTVWEDRFKEYKNGINKRLGSLEGMRNGKVGK